jgi:hypothetical protein
MDYKGQVSIPVYLKSKKSINMRTTDVAGLNSSTAYTNNEILEMTTAALLSKAEEMNAGDVPEKKPEVDPEKMPDENPGLVPETKPNRDNDEGADDDDDDDDDDENDPFTETEIGDDPDDIKTKTTIM